MKINKKDERGWVDVDEEKKKNKGNNERATFEVDGEKYTPYAVSGSYRFPLWLKACLAKWWFPGMVFYFIFFGLGRVGNQDLLIVVLGLAWGVVTDILLNHYFRDFSSPNHDYTKYILCGRKKSYFSLPINLVLGIVLSFLSAACIDIIVVILKNTGHTVDSDNFLFTYGGLIYPTFFLIFDLLLVFIRNMIGKLVRKIKSSKAVGLSETETVGDIEKTIEAEQISEKATVEEYSDKDKEYPSDAEEFSDKDKRN